MAVTSSLTGGVLRVDLSAANDGATLALVGPNVTVSDGNATNSYAVGSVALLNVVGTTADNQAVTIGSYLNLSGTFTSSGVDSLAFSNSVSFGARSTLVSHAMAVTGANTITVGAGATLFTRSFSGGDPFAGASTANSGGLSFTAKSISIGAGAKILAHADGAFQAGDIALTAKDARLDTYLIPLFNEKQANVSLNVADGAVFKGRNIELASDASAKRYTLYDLGTLATSPPTPRVRLSTRG